MSFIKAESFQIFAIKEFRLFVAMRFFLTLAIQMQFATISLQIYYEYTKSDLAQGMLGLTEALPAIVCCFFSGHFSDKFSRKKILIVGVVSLLISALFLVANALPNFNLAKSFGVISLYVIAFLFGIIRSLFAATTHPYMSQLVPRNFYTHSATWNSTAWQVGAILGPVLAGIIYSLNVKQNAYICHLLDCVFFLISFGCLLLIKNKGIPEKSETAETFTQGLKQGLRFVFKNKMVLSALSLDLFAVLLGGAVALLPSFNDKILHLGPQFYGVLRTAPAIGAVVMALIMAFYPPAKKAGLALLLSVAAFGLFTIVFAISTTFWLAFLALALTGAFDNVSVVVRHSILQLSTPNHMRGRVSAINSMFIGSSNEIGAFESGVTSNWFGLVPSIILGGCLTVGVVITTNIINPALKKLDLSKL